MATWSERQQRTGERTSCCDYVIGMVNGKWWCHGCGQQVHPVTIAARKVRHLVDPDARPAMSPYDAKRHQWMPPQQGTLL